MKENDAIKILIDKISTAYKNEDKKLHEMAEQGIIRGHRTAMSATIEDNIALLIKNVLPDNYKIFIDPSITINKKTYRPDIMIINNKQHVKAMLEIKANIGYCRNAKKELKKLENKHKKFYKCTKLKCSLSEKEVIYSKNTKCFFIVYSSDNCGDKENHEINKLYAKNLNIPYLVLFDGWYNNSTNRDIETFIKEIKK